MNLNKKILQIRKRFGLTQEELANKLFVTRQAVSRWEIGETLPSIDTLINITKVFDISVNSLLDLNEVPICQSCAMPMQKLEDFGSDNDKSICIEYCNHCFQEGKFTHNRTVEEMIEFNLKFLDEFNKENGTNYTEDEARNILKLHLVTLKRWKK